MAVPSTYAGTLTNMTYNDVFTRRRQPRAARCDCFKDAARTQLAKPRSRHSRFGNRDRSLARQRPHQHHSASDPSTGIMLSSWASVKLHELDFNIGLGKPLAVRRPAFVPVESLMYIMPKGASDETVVGMCLRDEDWTMLKQDKRWTRFAMYVG